MAERMLLELAESDCPIFRATSPLSRGRLKSKGHGKLSIHCAADLETIETIFRIIVSANQLCLYLHNFHNFMQWDVVNILFQEKKEHHNQKDGSRETPRLGLYWNLQLVACMVSMELRSEFGP